MTTDTEDALASLCEQQLAELTALRKDNAELNVEVNRLAGQVRALTNELADAIGAHADWVERQLHKKHGDLFESPNWTSDEAPAAAVAGDDYFDNYDKYAGIKD